MDRERFSVEALPDWFGQLEVLVHRGEQCEIVHPRGDVLLILGQPSDVISPFDLGQVESSGQRSDEPPTNENGDFGRKSKDEWLDL